MVSQKALGPVVAMSLFLVLTIIAALSFNTFLQNYESDLTVQIENKETINDLVIKNVVGNVIYVEASKAQNISSVKINGRDCELSPKLSQGINGIDIGTCIGNLSTDKPEISLVSPIGVLSKKVFLEQRGIPVFLKNFEESYGTGGSRDAYWDLIELSNGQYVGAGNYGNGSDEAFLLTRFDSQGNKVWEYNKSSGTTSGVSLARGALAHSDGSIYGSGHFYNGYDESFYVAKLDNDGTVLWEYTTDEGVNQGQGRSITELYDGNVLASAERNESGILSMFLVKLNKNTGEEIWNTTYRTGSSTNRPKDMIELNNNSILVIGDINSGGFNHLLILFDENGTAIWNKTQDSGNGNDFAYQISASSDGNYLLTGDWENSNGDLFIQKITPEGINIWNVTIDSGFGDDVASGVAELSDGNIMISGWMSQSGSTKEAFFMKLNSTGSELFNETYVDDGSSWNFFSSKLYATSDGGFIAGGYGYNGSKGYQVIIKTDSSGISCSFNLSDNCFSYR